MPVVEIARPFGWLAVQRQTNNNSNLTGLAAAKIVERAEVDGREKLRFMNDK